MNTIQKLQKWYSNQCNADWEHDFGVRLETLDNPGWSITIDLQLTPLEGVEFEVSNEVSELDWYHLGAKDNKFVGFGDPDKLDFMINYFLDVFVPKFSNPEFEYQILIPLYGAPVDVWTNGRAKMVDGGGFRITEIEKPDSKTMLCKSFDNIDSWFWDFDNFQVLNEIGDVIEGELVETFQGVRLAKGKYREKPNPEQ